MIIIEHASRTHERVSSEQRFCGSGDKINFGSTAGATVKRMGYFRTVLQTKDKTLLIVPNGNFLSKEIVNGGSSHSRIAGSFTLRLDDRPKLQSLIMALTNALKNVPQARRVCLRSKRS